MLSQQIVAEARELGYVTTVFWLVAMTNLMMAMRMQTVADHGYSDSQAAPSKFPAGLFSILLDFRAHFHFK
mgnify:CR=1 FL=1